MPARRSSDRLLRCDPRIPSRDIACSHDPLGLDHELYVQPGSRDDPRRRQGHVEEQRSAGDRTGPHRDIRRRPHVRLGGPAARIRLLVHIHQSGHVRVSLQRAHLHARHDQSHRHNDFPFSNPDPYSPQVDRDGDGQADGCARVANSHVPGEAVASRVQDTDAFCHAHTSRLAFGVPESCGCRLLVVIEGKRRGFRVGCGRTRRRRCSRSVVASRAQNASVTHTSHTSRRVRKRVN